MGQCAPWWMKGWSLDANIQTEVLTWWFWRSLRTDIRTKLPKGSAVAIHFITDFWAWLPCYTCPSSSEQSCACKLPGSTTVYSFCTSVFLQFGRNSHLPRKLSAHFQNCPLPLHLPTVAPLKLSLVTFMIVCFFGILGVNHQLKKVHTWL